VVGLVVATRQLRGEDGPPVRMPCSRHRRDGDPIPVVAARHTESWLLAARQPGVESTDVVYAFLANRLARLRSTMETPTRL